MNEHPPPWFWILFGPFMLLLVIAAAIVSLWMTVEEFEEMSTGLVETLDREVIMGGAIMTWVVIYWIAINVAIV